MTIQKPSPQSGHRHAGTRLYKLGHAVQAVRHTDAWEHETFAEEQARWERDDSEYAQLCEQVRQARDRGEEASRRADQAKADWDARVATQRQANDNAQKAHHALKTDLAAQTPGEVTNTGDAPPEPPTAARTNPTPIGTASRC